MVVLTERVFRFSLFISQLLAKAIPVRGAKFKKPAQGNLSGLFAFREPHASGYKQHRTVGTVQRPVCDPRR